MSCVFVPLTTLTMEPIPREETGYATSLFAVMRNIGSSVGISFVPYIRSPAGLSITRPMLVAHVTPYDQPFRSFLGNQGVYGARRIGPQHGRPAGPGRPSTRLLQTGFAAKLIEAFKDYGILFLACMSLVFLMRKQAHLGA